MTIAMSDLAMVRLAAKLDELENAVTLRMMASRRPSAISRLPHEKDPSDSTSPSVLGEWLSRLWGRV